MLARFLSIIGCLATFALAVEADENGVKSIPVSILGIVLSHLEMPLLTNAIASNAYTRFGIAFLSKVVCYKHADKLKNIALLRF